MLNACLLSSPSGVRIMPTRHPLPGVLPAAAGARAGGLLAEQVSRFSSLVISHHRVYSMQGKGCDLLGKGAVLLLMMHFFVPTERAVLVMSW